MATEKALDEVFCTSCGKAIKQAALMCVHCGVANAAAPVPVINNAVATVRRVPKQKSSAILLAVFLSFWTWLYTYDKDAWKFWLNLVLCLVLAIPTLFIYPIAAWIWAIIDVSVKPDSYYQNYPD